MIIWMDFNCSYKPIIDAMIDEVNNDTLAFLVWYFIHFYSTAYIVLDINSWYFYVML